MVRFRLHDDDNQLESTVAQESLGVLTEYDSRRSRAPMAHRVEDTLPANAPAFVLAYQLDGTPCLVPFNAPKEPRKTSWWFWIPLFAIVFQLVVWYGPPAPPTKDETWNEFLNREVGTFVQSAKSLLSILPHVSFWVSKCLHAEISDFLKPSSCPLEVPRNLAVLKDTIIGQSLAVDTVMQALYAWNKDEKALILVLSGTLGVGKMKLAETVAAQTVCESSVMLVEGSNYGEPHELLMQVRRQISDGGGHVVIFKHPEDMMHLSLLETLQSLGSTPNLIILITTHIGSRVIHRHLKEEGTSSTLALELALRHELDTELGVGVSESVTAIAPFVPLGPVELQQILIQKVAQNWNVKMSLRLAQEWTSPTHIEYLAWTSQGRTIQTFSSRGAKVLDEALWRRLVAQIRECGVDDMVDAELDLEDNRAIMRVCSTDHCNEICQFPLSFY